MSEDHPTDPAPPSHQRLALAKLADNGWKSDAGVIDNLMHGGFGTGTVSVLYCAPGSVRARHHHKTDDHYLYVVSGFAEYYEREIGSTVCPEAQIFHEREMFYTPPGREHAIRFPEGAILVSISSKSRTHDEHEADVVRVEFKLPGE